MTQNLQILGLKPEESALYFKLLANVGMTAGALAKHSGLARPSVYEYLANLQKTGLVRQSLRHGVKHFTAAPPETITTLFDRQLTELEKQKAAFEQILPGLALGQFAFYRAALPAF